MKIGERMKAMFKISTATAWNFINAAREKYTNEDEIFSFLHEIDLRHLASEDKFAFVTGSTSGIGFHTAAILHCLGINVILLSRHQGKAEKAAAEIRRLRWEGEYLAAMGISSDQLGDKKWEPKIEILTADYENLDSIRKLVTKIQEKGLRINILVNNAGIVDAKFRRGNTIDGHDTTFQTNFLAPFLLTNLLLPELVRNGPGSRIVNVSSDIGFGGIFDPDDIEWTKKRLHTGLQEYANSKLFVMMFSLHLNQLLEEKGLTKAVTVQSLSPGAVRTNILEQTTHLVNMAFRMGTRPFLMDAKRGASTTILLCLHPSLNGVSGRYFSMLAEYEPPKHAMDPDSQATLWKIAENMTGIKTAHILRAI